MKKTDINDHLPSDHLQDDKALLDRLEFEQLISDLSARFMNISPDKMDEEIERSLKLIYEFFGCDRCALLEGFPDKTKWKIAHVAARENLPPVPVGEELPIAINPWIFEKLIQKREILVISNLDDLPAEADGDRQILMQWGIRSIVSIPIIIDESVDYVININAVNNECAWPQELISRVQLLGEMIVNAIERNKSRLQIDEQLRFEGLISNLSSDFVNIPSDHVDDTIRKWLRTLVEFFQVDRCTIGLFSNESNRLSTTYNYQVSGADSPPPSATTEQLPWYFGQLIAGKDVIINRVEDLPPDALAERRLCLNMNVKSILAVPLRMGGHTLGSCVFVSTRAERIWPERLIPRLRLVGEVFANAILRKQTDVLLREREERISLITEAVDAGLWIMDVDTKKVWVSPKSREIFQFAPDEEITYERYFRVIHPEDRDRVHREVAHTLQSGETLHCDYRIILSDGTIRWIVARGQRYLQSTGETIRLLGLSLDITERKETELKLNESQTLLSSLINSTPDLIWSVDPERFGLVVFNRGLSEYFLHGSGLHIEIGMNPDDLLPTEEFAQKWYAFYRRALKEGSFITDYQTSAQGRTLRLNINTLKHDDVVFGLSVFAQDITERRKMENQLQQQLAEINNLKTRLEEENVYLRNEIKMELGLGTIIGESDAIKYVLFRSQQVAPTDATVLILGDTGTGKGMVAHAIHEMSSRKDKPMVTINCAALPENLIESELFGREKGAFTGAHATQVGRFEVAHGGTLFMDEIGEMPLALQTKLLRVLQDGEFERLGSTKTIKVDVRVITATSRDLKADVRNGRFREDLFYRLNVFPVSIPPLSMRLEDIPLLVNYFVGKYNQKYGRQIEIVSRNTLQKLQAYHWPGNVRELEHVIERAVIISSGPELNIIDSLERETIDKGKVSLKDMETTEREHILKVLQKTRWKIDGEGGAAVILGLNPSTLRFRIKKLGITRP